MDAETGPGGVTGAWLAAMRPRVVRLAKRFLRDGHDAEEVAQEALTLVWRRANGLREPAKRDAWLYRTAINLSISRLRRARTELSLQPDQRARDDRHVGEAQQHVELAERIRQVVIELPDREHAAIALRDMEQLSYDRIATVLQTREGTVRVLVHRARERVRNELLRRWPDTFGSES